jgi:hypothetical protein
LATETGTLQRRCRVSPRMVPTTVPTCAFRGCLTTPAARFVSRMASFPQSWSGRDAGGAPPRSRERAAVLSNKRPLCHAESVAFGIPCARKRFHVLTATDWSHGGCARPDHRRARPDWFAAFLADRGRRKPSAHTIKVYRHDFDALRGSELGATRTARRRATESPALCIRNSLSRSVRMCRAPVTGDRRTHRTPRRDA